MPRPQMTVPPARRVTLDQGVGHRLTVALGRRVNRAAWRVGLLGAVTAIVLPGAATAQLPERGGQFRISTTGAERDRSRAAFRPAVAYNSADDEYLAVRFADLLDGNPFKADVFAQRLSSTGRELGGDVRVSTTGDDGDTSKRIFTTELDVAYGSATNEYLTVWSSDLLAGPGNEFEIRGQRISAAGVELGSDLQISHARASGDATANAFDPAVAYNSGLGEYLVVWADDRLRDQQWEVFAQRLSPSGQEVGPALRVSSSPEQADVFRPDIAYNAADDEYLVIWGGDVLAGPARKAEVLGQRLSGDGQELGGDFRISHSGPDEPGRGGAGAPAVAYNPAGNQYLVVWNGSDADVVAPEDFEIFAQRISAAGGELGSDFRVSRTKPDGDPASGAFFPAIVSGSASGESLVSRISGLRSGAAAQISAQRISAAGVPLGSDFQVSNAPPGDERATFAEFPALSHGATANEYLAVWNGDASASPGEVEIFGQRLQALPVPPPPEGPPSPPGP